MLSGIDAGHLLKSRSVELVVQVTCLTWTNDYLLRRVSSQDPFEKALDEVGVGAVDFIKVDAEGAELDILQGGERTLSAALGLISEVRLHEGINGSPPFAALDAYVRSQGLRLYNLDLNKHGRVALPYPQICDYRTPSSEKFYAYTSHGQVQDGDALYLVRGMPGGHLTYADYIKAYFDR